METQKMSKAEKIAATAVMEEARRKRWKETIDYWKNTPNRSDRQSLLARRERLEEQLEDAVNHLDYLQSKKCDDGIYKEMPELKAFVIEECELNIRIMYDDLRDVFYLLKRPKELDLEDWMGVGWYKAKAPRTPLGKPLGWCLESETSASMKYVAKCFSFVIKHTKDKDRKEKLRRDKERVLFNRRYQRSKGKLWEDMHLNEIEVEKLGIQTPFDSIFPSKILSELIEKQVPSSLKCMEVRADALKATKKLIRAIYTEYPELKKRRRKK